MESQGVDTPALFSCLVGLSYSLDRGYVVLGGQPRLLAGPVFFGFYQCYETVKQARAHGDSDDRNRTVRPYVTNSLEIRYGRAAWPAEPRKFFEKKHKILLNGFRPKAVG